MNSSITVDRTADGVQRPVSRRPPLSTVAWNICILISANDAYMRDLALSSSDKREAAVDRTSTGFEEVHLVWTGARSRAGG
jgi:hypothetical protein